VLTAYLGLATFVLFLDLSTHRTTFGGPSGH